jgi:hypothetical protein
MKFHTMLDFINADITISRIVNVYYAKAENWARPKKIAREYEGVLFFISGSIEYDFGDFVFKALPGQIVRLPSGIPYNGCKLENSPNHFMCVDFITALPEEFINLPLPLSFTPTDKESAAKSFIELEESFHSNSLGYKLDCKNQLTLLLAMLTKDYAVNRCKYDNRSQIIRYCEYLRENAGRHNLRISELSEKFHVSETHIRRIFNSELGASPGLYQN